MNRIFTLTFSGSEIEDAVRRLTGLKNYSVENKEEAREGILTLLHLLNLSQFIAEETVSARINTAYSRFMNWDIKFKEIDETKLESIKKLEAFILKKNRGSES